MTDRLNYVSALVMSVSRTVEQKRQLYTLCRKSFSVREAIEIEVNAIRDALPTDIDPDLLIKVVTEYMRKV